MLTYRASAVNHPCREGAVALANIGRLCLGSRDAAPRHVTTGTDPMEQQQNRR